MQTPGDRGGRRVGKGPYREARPVPDRAPVQQAAKGVGASTVVVVLLRLLYCGVGTEPPVERGRYDAPLVRGGSMAGGDRVLVLEHEGGGQVIVRVPGRYVRRGADVVRAPDAVTAPGVVGLQPGAVAAVAVRNVLMTLSERGELEVFDEPVGAHGPAVQLVKWGVTRTWDGATGPFRSDEIQGRPEYDGARAVDVASGATDVCALLEGGVVRCRAVVEDDGRGNVRFRDEPVGLRSLAMPDAEQVAVGGSVVCARGRAGAVRCVQGATIPMTDDPLPLRGSLPRARELAVSRDDLCAIGWDGWLRCANGPSRDPVRDGLVGPVELVPSLGGVLEVALGDDAGCARRHDGGVACWGPLARGGWVVHRDTPVPMEGLDAATALVATRGQVCALQRGEVLCWGERHAPRPRRVALPGAVTSIAGGTGAVCATTGRGAPWCWGGDARPREVSRGGASLRSVAAAGDRFCGLDAEGRAWCFHASERDGLVRVPWFDGLRRIVGQWADTCALRDGAPPSCVGLSAAHRLASWDIGEGRWRALERDHVEPLIECTSRPNGGLHCESFDRPYLRTLPWGELGGEARAIEGTLQRACALGVNGRVACTHLGSDAMVEALGERGRPPAVVPGLDDAVELAVSGGLACARRAGGGVVCWGDNASGALTAAEAGRSPRLVPLRW